jgi:hypothetical protein
MSRRMARESGAGRRSGATATGDRTDDASVVGIWEASSGVDDAHGKRDDVGDA